jgi:hypothetical protein
VDQCASYAVLLSTYCTDAKKKCFRRGRASGSFGITEVHYVELKSGIEGDTRFIKRIKGLCSVIITLVAIWLTAAIFLCTS